MTGGIAMTSDLWTRENLAWCAGIFEGEGSLHWTSPQPQKEDGRHPGGQSLVISIGMTDEDVLRTFHKYAGVGTIYGPYQAKPPSTKPHWTYRAQGKDAYALMVAMWHWLHGRRKENAAQAMRQWLNSHPKRLLAADQVMAIRKAYADGGTTYAALGAIYGVSGSTIHLIMNGTTYKWVK
jgi:hypothetical protein